MRTFTLALVLALIGLAAPATAQVSFSPVVGFDLEAEGPLVGLAFEIGAPLENLPLTPSIRPIVEYVFADSGDFGSQVDVSIIRARGDLLARFNLGPDSNLSPYGFAGAGIEYIDVSVDGGLGGGASASETEFIIAIGGGLEFTRFFVEGDLGLSGGVEGLRVRAGYRF
ncbi:outer membrane protein [Rubrivirga sp.]|uniref:outer membrane protein n=1 Tax=Rubrivirga sp. TaxID=1885344 RepID=UPI003B525313